MTNLERLKALIAKSDLTISCVAGLAALFHFEGLSEASISRALTKGRPLSYTADKNLEKLLSRLESVVNSAGSSPVSFTDAQKTKEVLDDIDNHGVAIIVLQGSKPIEET